MWIGDRLRQFWRALTQDGDEATAQAQTQVQLMRAAQQLDNLLQKHQMLPGIDYSISLRSRKFGVSLDSPRANHLARTQPQVRVALDALLNCLGELDGQAGYPCRLPKSPAYVASWKQASQHR